MAISDKTLILEKIKLSFVVSISKKKVFTQIEKIMASRSKVLGLAVKSNF